MPTENDLAEALAKAKTEEERTGLLAHEKELVPANSVQALGIQGDRFTNQGRLSQALAIHRLAQSIGEQIGDQTGIAGTLNNIGNIHYTARQLCAGAGASPEESGAERGSERRGGDCRIAE